MGRKNTTGNPHDQRKDPRRYHAWNWKHITKPKRARMKRRRK